MTLRQWLVNHQWSKPVYVNQNEWDEAFIKFCEDLKKFRQTRG